MPKQILLVEDSVTMQKVVQITFAREDYQIVATTNVDEALAKCREQRPDIVLADASLPGKTGYELAASLRADGSLKDVPVLLMTGHFNPYDEPRAQKSGIDAHIVKPFETQSLLDKVATLVKGRSAGAPASAPAKPAPEAAPPVAKPVVAAAPEQRSTMMGIAPGAAAAPRPAPAVSARNAVSQPGASPAPPSPPPNTEGSRMPEPVRTSASPAGIPSQVPQMPRPSLIPRAPVPAPVLAALERIAARGAEYEAIAKLSAEAIQQIVWEIVPELAEVIIRAEVDRLAKERKA